MDAALPNDPGATLTHVLPKRKPGNMAPRPHGPDAARQDAPGRAQCGISQIRIICRRRSGARPEGPRARNPVTTSGGLLDSGFATSWRPGMTSFVESLRSPCRLRWLAFARRPRDRAARHRNPARPGEAAMQDVPTKATARPFKWVGTRPVRPDGVPKVTGRALYGADLAMPGMLVGRVLRSPHAHALDRYFEGGRAARRQGRGDRRGLPGAEVRVCRPGTRRAELLAHDPQHHGARKGPLRGPRGRRGGGDQQGHRR